MDNEPDDRPRRKGARCPSCGRRVGASGCPLHGIPHETEPRQESSSEPEGPLPEFKGYRTERVLGRGGFGTVYAAWTLPSTSGAPARPVAIKLARGDRPGAAKRLVQELMALQLVGPPQVPAVIDAGDLAPNQPYVVMELVEARTLGQILVSRDGPLGPTEVATFALALLASVEAVHEEGLVHLDLKPENVLLAEPSGRATVLDLGLARRAGVGAAGSSERPADGKMIGTMDYMAPEQCEGKTNLDARADVYAIGVMLYEMLAGHPPFWGPPAAVREGHLSRRPPRFALELGVPPALEEAVMKCLEKDPAARYASAALLRKAIAQAVVEQSAAPQSVGRAPVEPKPKTASDAGASERRTVSLLHFASPLDPIALRTKIEAIGGYVMKASGGRYVVAFGHEAVENPARLSLRAAQELVAQKICESVWVDLANVSVTMRPDGSKRLLHPNLARVGQAPRPEGPAPILLSPAARAVLTEIDLSAASELLGSKAVAEVDFTGMDDPTTRLGLVGPPLVGRDDLLETLALSAMRAVGDGVPSVATIIGEAGHGKSHLRRLLVERLHRVMPPGCVVDLRAREPVVGGGDSVKELFVQALNLQSVPVEAEARKAALRDRLGPTASPEGEAALALALGWISPGGDETFPGLRALEAAPFALNATLRVAGGEALRQRAADPEKGPLCVVLDDAQFADESTLAVLEHATLAEARARIFVCALSRPVFRENHPSWGERAAHRDVFELGPLDPPSAAALCRALLHPAENVPESAVRRLVERTQGIPLLLVELVRGLRVAGIVRRHAGGRGFYVATDEIDRVPDLPLIEWLAHRELDALSASLRAHARLVATVGVEVTPEEVSGILRGVLKKLDDGEAGEFPLDVRIGIERLLKAGVLRRQRQGRVGFRHALVREAIARGVPEPLRRKIHLASAEYYGDAVGATDALPEEQRLPQLAFHAARAGLAEVAEVAYLDLAESARKRHAYVDAERFYTLALEQSTKRDERSREAHRGRGLMRYRVGRYHDALTDFAEARVAAREAGDVIEVAAILLDEATALDWMGEHVLSRENVLAAQALAEKRTTPLLSARLMLGLGRSHYRFSCPDEALAALGKAATEAASLGEEGYETQVIALLMLGLCEQGISHLEEAERSFERAIALCEKHGDAMHLASSMNNRSILRAMQGDRVRMAEDCERVIALGRELGQDYLELLGHNNLGEFLYLVDQVDAALPHIARAREIDERRSPGAPRPEIMLLEARTLLYRGDLDGARSLTKRLRADRAEPLTVLSDDVLCTMVELSSGEADDEAWDALEERSVRYSIGQERIEVIEARGLWALRHGRPAEARRTLSRALELAIEIKSVMAERVKRRLREAAG